MRTLLRRPLTWLVAAEVAIVAALALAAWHVHESQPATAAPPGSAILRQPARPQSPPPLTTARSPSPSVSPGLARSSPHPSPSVRPGLATDDGFLARQAAALNHDQAAWERMQWSLVHTAIQQGRRYIETVVVPAVLQALQRRSRADPAAVARGRDWDA